jgi:hypothetical protein
LLRVGAVAAPGKVHLADQVVDGLDERTDARAELLDLVSERVQGVEQLRIGVFHDAGV